MNKNLTAMTAKLSTFDFVINKSLFRFDLFFKLPLLITSTTNSMQLQENIQTCKTGFQLMVTTERAKNW